jgi:hypothetical protein
MKDVGTFEANGRGLFNTFDVADIAEIPSILSKTTRTRKYP